MGVRDRGVRVSAAALGAFTRFTDLDVPGFCDLGLGDGDGEHPVRHLRIDLPVSTSPGSRSRYSKAPVRRVLRRRTPLRSSSLISPVTTSSWPLASTLMSLLLTPGSSISTWKASSDSVTSARGCPRDCGRSASHRGFDQSAHLAEQLVEFRQRIACPARGPVRHCAAAVAPDGRGHSHRLLLLLVISSPAGCHASQADSFGRVCGEVSVPPGAAV